VQQQNFLELYLPSVSFCAAKKIAGREPPALCGLNWIGIELELEKIDR
jgi:hypothetical protein